MGTLEFPGEEVAPSVPKLAGLSRLLCAAIFDYVSGHSIAGALRFENFYVGKTMFIAASAITSSRCASRVRIYSENDDANCIGSRQAPTKALLGLALAEYRVLLNSHYFHRDIISGGFGIGAQLVCPIDKLLSGFFINIWHGNPEFYRKTKALAFFA